jgi:hypothetical protein
LNCLIMSIPKSLLHIMISPPGSVIDLPDLSTTLPKIMPLNAHKLENLGVTKLWKLIDFIDVAFLRETGKALTDSTCDSDRSRPLPGKARR